MADFLRSHGAELREEYDNFDEEELDELRESVTERRKAKETAVRDKPKARQKDVQNTFDNMKRDVCYQKLHIFYLF